MCIGTHTCLTDEPFTYMASIASTNMSDVRNIMQRMSTTAIGQLVHRAVEEGKMPLLNALLFNGANVDAIGDCGRTPLCIAARLGDSIFVDKLFAYHARVYALDDTLRTPLHWATLFGHKTCVCTLLTHGADTDVKDEDGCTALHLASDAAIMRILVGYNASVSAIDNDQRTPLHWAAVCGNRPCVRFLLEHGANIHAKDVDGCTAIHLATDSNHMQTFRLLMDWGADMFEPAGDGQNTRVRAGLGGHTNIVNFISTYGMPCGHPHNPALAKNVYN